MLIDPHMTLAEASTAEGGSADGGTGRQGGAEPSTGSELDTRKLVQVGAPPTATPLSFVPCTQLHFCRVY